MNAELVVLGRFGEVDIMSRPSDLMVDVTAMCKANGRKWSKYAESAGAKRFKEALSRSLRNSEGPLVVQIGDGLNESRGTFAHRRIALHCAAWISAEFEVWVYERIEELLATGRTELPQQPKSQFDVLRAMLDQMESQALRLYTVEEKVDEVVNFQKDAVKRLMDVDRSSEHAPPMSTRNKVNQLVRSYCQATRQEYGDVYGRLYKAMYYLHGFDASVRAKNQNKRPIDVIEEAGLMEKLFAIASDALAVAS